MKELTIKEAIEQGYTKYGFEDQDDQFTNDLHDDVFEEYDEEYHGGMVLFEKETVTPKIGKDYLSDTLPEPIFEYEFEELIGLDDLILDEIKAIDYTEITEKINKVLGKHKYWILTDIHLVK